MRLWSIHPQYLDAKGLVALWREALLAKKVLEGKTSGYKNHPQLNRFRTAKNPLNCINQYLSVVYYEAGKRGYHFDKNKIEWNFISVGLPVTIGQVKYETNHLLSKLKVRDRIRYNKLKEEGNILTHPLFKKTQGKIEDWEII
jgi:hypothetical protein